MVGHGPCVIFPPKLSQINHVLLIILYSRVEFPDQLVSNKEQWGCREGDWFEIKKFILVLKSIKGP